MPHHPFNYTSLSDLKHDIAVRKLAIDLDTDFSVFSRRVPIGHTAAPNAIASLPMEGCDSNPDGSPSESVFRRYRRIARGGAGLIWAEANAVVPEGKANELQLMITDKNWQSFQKLIGEIHASAAQAFSGENLAKTHRPVVILQLTHSGRYARPHGHTPAPLVPQRDPLLDPVSGVISDAAIVSDEYLDKLTDRYVKSALLAKKAGFDGVDIKACHRYLVSELLAAHTRAGPYGGDFSNRSRFLLQTIKAVKAAAGNDFIIASRFNVFDAHPYPYGFGIQKDDCMQFDSTEPLRLVQEMIRAGVQLISNSEGNPYYRYPQITRPFDTSSQGIPVPEEHQLKSIERLFDFTRQIQNAARSVPVVGNGYSWLRQFLPYAGAANLKSGSCSFMGLGREMFAYPQAPRDIIERGALDAAQCCITCSCCTQIMRDHGKTGCVIKDKEIYGPMYKKYRIEAENRRKQKD